MKPRARRSVIASYATIERRIGTELGRSAHGRLVAADRRTGRYVVADDLSKLVDAIDGARLRSPRLYIFRVGKRAAVALRRAMALEPLGVLETDLADGTRVVEQAFSGTVLFDGTPRRVAIR